MALEERGGNYYYYRKERDGNRVISKYYGKGELASLIAQMDEIECYEMAEKIEIQRKNRERTEKTDVGLIELERKTQFLIKDFLTKSGFYQTTSREWRFKNNAG